MKLSVVIPCYNEEVNLQRGVLAKVHKFLKGKNFSWEVIVSDDGSTDKSRQIIKREIRNYKGFRLLENPHKGKPSALAYGIAKAVGKYILFTDMDQSTPIEELDKLLPLAEKGSPVVIGSRGMSRKDFPLYRKLGAVVFLSIRRLMILPEIKDTQCGFKLFEAKYLKKAFDKLEFFKTHEEASGWKVTSYDVELLHILKKMGLAIAEVPVVWRDEDVSKSKGGGIARYTKESREMFLQIVRVKINDLRGMYEQ